MNARRGARVIETKWKQNECRHASSRLPTFRLVGLTVRRYAVTDMGDEFSILTGQPVTDHGIYQSACSCRTALTLLVGQTLPRCMGCDEAVEWRLVQEIRPSKPPSQRQHPSGTRFVAAKVAARPPLDSASGDD